MPRTDDASTTWLTQDAFDRLSGELEHLVANRTAMAQEINDRREEGDLKENGGYHAAREEQGKQEGRIAQLQALLRSARVGEAPVSDGVAGPGMLVSVRFEGDDERGELPHRLARGGRDGGRRGVLLGVPAGQGPDWRARGRHRRVRDAERPHDEGHPRHRQSFHG